MDKKLKALSIISVGLFSSSLVQAESKIRTDAFATAGGTFSDSSVPFEGAQKDINFNKLSRIGLQYTFTPAHDIPVSFTGQLLARGYSDWGIEAEWALISYRPSTSWLVNFGKIRTSMLMLSQFHDVGVSYPWVTPPEESYGFANVPFTSISGVEVINTQFVGDWTMKTKLQTGNRDFDVPAMGQIIPVQLQHINQLRFDVNNDNLNMSFGFTKASFESQEFTTLASNPAIQNSFAGLAQMANIPLENLADPEFVKGLAQGMGLADTTNGRVAVYDIGFVYDNDLLLIAEMVKRRITNSTFPNTSSGFITAGYHFNNITPLITYALIDTNGSIIQQEQKSISLGLNYAPSTTSILKIDFKTTQVGDGSVALPIPGAAVSNVALFDTLPLEFGGAAIKDKVNKISITYSIVL